MGRAAEGWRVVPGRHEDDNLYVRFRHAGKRPYLSTGTRDPVQAAERAATIYAEVVSGRRRPEATLRSSTPLDELVASYLEHVEATGGTDRFSMQYQHMNVHVLPFFRSLAEIGSEASWADFEARRRRQGIGTGTIAKELSTLRSFAKWCRQRRVLEAVPEYRAPKITSDFSPLCLEAAQVDRILAALPVKATTGRHAGKHVRARFVFAWETALRPGTIERLRVDDYDRAQKRLRVRDSIDKARFGRDLPLSERARRALEAVAPSSGLIFGRARFRDSLKAAALAARLPKDIAERVTPYTFRHSRITHLASVTTDLRGLAYLAGHKDLTTTSHYVHGNVAAGERVLAAAAASGKRSGRQPPDRGHSGSRSGRRGPPSSEQDQHLGAPLTGSGSCGVTPVRVQLPPFAP